MAIAKEWLEFLRQQYPKGSRIRLREMDADAPQPLEPGSMGTLEHIDDFGTFHVKWDNGHRQGMVVGKDSFTVLPPELVSLKFYMPLTANIGEFCGNDGRAEDDPTLDGQGLVEYKEAILKAIQDYQTPLESPRGIMHWYSEKNSVAEKVKSVFFTVEERKGQLWGVADCRVSAIDTLTPEELVTLTDYITGQASSSWGDGFAQWDIDLEGKKLYVHFWNSDDWSIMTEEQRFLPKVAEGLPELCFSTLLTTGKLICIKRGETGYYPSDWDTGDKERNVELADQLNEALGVTMWQRQAMEVGSMCGWDVPGADPSKYQESYDPQMGGMTLA